MGQGASYGLRMYEVFPIAMSEIKGSWAEQEPVRLDISFSYRYWRSLNADSYERRDPDAPNYSFVDYTIPSRQEVVGEIDVVGETGGRRRDVVGSIDVVGTTADVLDRIDVVGTR